MEQAHTARGEETSIMTNNRKKLSASSINRSERLRANVDFDDAITVRSKDMAPRIDDRDAREELVWELAAFRWN
jgi:hypothetical protein